MAEKIFSCKSDLRERVLAGVDAIADNVASTLGPCGRNVILHAKDKNPIITKDGVTVAKFVNLKDPVMNAAAEIVKQASSKTNALAGDGTTTSTVLARAILREAQKYLVAGVSPTELKRGMDKATSLLVNVLGSMSSPISSEKDIAHIATISSNGDDVIGKLIARAVDLCGKDGAITVEEARSVETSLEVVEGFRLSSGYLASAFITDERRGAVKYNDPLILVTDEEIDMVEEIMPILEVVARESRPLVIIASNIEGQALAALIMNAMRGTLKVAAVKAPRYGEERRGILEDLAVSIGATFITKRSRVKLKELTLENLGSAKSNDILKALTTIVDGKGAPEEIEKRIEKIKTEIEQTESITECARLQERITKLASGIAIIKVGAATEIEMIEKKHRIEDALEAVRSARQEGIVAGGGVALINAAKGLDPGEDIPVGNEEQRLGASIILEIAKEPLRQMAINAGESPDLILDKVLSAGEGEGWDFSKNKPVSMLKEGIIDPAKVTRCALQNAVSVASTLITTNYAIIER